MTSPMPAAREPALVDAFVALVDTLVDDYDVIDLLHHLVETVGRQGRPGRGRYEGGWPGRLRWSWRVPAPSLPVWSALKGGERVLG